MAKIAFLMMGALASAAVTAAVSNPRFVPAGNPCFVGRDDVVLGKFYLDSDCQRKQDTVEVDLTGTKSGDLKSIFFGRTKGTIAGDKAIFRVPVVKGECFYTVYAEPAAKPDILSRKIVIQGVPVRVGSLVTRPNQEILDVGRKSKNFRIPGVAVTPKGTLVAVFDNRFHHSGDLPADITVGVSTSKDGGNTWSPIRTALGVAGIPGGHGIGDPCVLVDPSNGRIWVAAMRAPNSGHPIWASEKGTIDPKRCAQFILAYSDDEGQTWSAPINITENVKRLGDPDTADWGVVFQGPGAGIALADGTLIFPAQVWGHRGKAPHHSLLVYSTDHGKTWTSSKENPYGGSESVAVQLPDGSVLLNTREGQGPASRVTARTTDLGQTWEKVETTPLRQPNNLCQAAMLAMGDNLYFSNPDSAARDTMTLRRSSDGGKTWPKKVVYDKRPCAGYSSLVPLGSDAVGVLYEGASDYHYFLRIPLEELE